MKKNLLKTSFIPLKNLFKLLDWNIEVKLSLNWSHNKQNQ